MDMLFAVSKSQSKSQAASSRELPSDLKVGYSILDRRFNYYCEQCNMAMLPSDIKIGILLSLNCLHSFVESISFVILALTFNYIVHLKRIPC